MPSTPLHVLVLDANTLRAAVIEDGLREAGDLRVTVLTETEGLVENIVALDPDVIFIDLENPNRDQLEHMFQVSRAVRRPVAMFVDRSDTAAVEAAIEAGVSAYIVDGLRKERVKPILDMAISRFNAFDRLRRELEATKSELAERKQIERAKTLLIKSRGLSEPEAYALLRRTAMNQNRRIAEVAESLVMAASLLGKGLGKGESR
ncbi:MAG: ANTAR domain-containing protein [Alphaproteobacteria bacterium]|nr:ANTAR domain-containing protein [Alphaproteobacteria bacterium]MCB9931082.1 ANTAR domain-containing protein [Alphaproteobacteria bacterium]